MPILLPLAFLLHPDPAHAQVQVGNMTFYPLYEASPLEQYVFWVSCAMGYHGLPMDQRAVFFDPIEQFVDKQNRWEGENWGFKGNWRPINEEQHYEIIELSYGHVPTDISGVYLRNGPNLNK